MNGICVENEFIQVTEVVPESSAHICGVLPGDIIVYIKQECVLGTCREDVLTLLDSFSVGDTVNFQLCRGYALQETMDSRFEGGILQIFFHRPPVAVLGIMCWLIKIRKKIFKKISRRAIWMWQIMEEFCVQGGGNTLHKTLKLK
uniref:PDZ domain-containing protein n=1 Tax=Meloidogyne incognita TaxID=6306 RepID=A0A914MZQ6_MELIC